MYIENLYLYLISLKKILMVPCEQGRDVDENRGELRIQWEFSYQPNTFSQ